MKKQASFLVLATLSFGILSQPLIHAESASTPGSMAALGDSITAGALAGFTRADAHNPFILAKILYFIGKLGIKGLKGAETPARSWSTGMGNKVRSQARRLNEMAREEGYNLGIANLAVSGSTSDDLLNQANRSIAWSSKYMSTKGPDYVTIATGANDACGKTNEEMTPASTYGNNLRNAVFKILDTNPNSKVLISGMPNIVSLREVAANSLLTGIPPLMRCRNMWATHHFCDNVLLEKNTEKVAEVKQRLEDYLAEIEAVTEEANARFGSDRVRSALNVYDYKFSDQDISIDCFHPNWRGQNILASETWKKTWWAKDK